MELNRSISNQLTSTCTKGIIDKSVEEKAIGNHSAIVLGTSVDEVINTMNESLISENICTFPTSAKQAIKKVKKSKKKIHRPFPYCQTGKIKSALTRYLKQVHKNEPDFCSNSLLANEGAKKII